MSPTPKPLWSKKSLILMGMVLLGSMLLAGAATFSMYEDKSKATSNICYGTMDGIIVFSKTSDGSPFEFVDQKGNHFQPVLQSNESVLSKTGHASICYSSIETNNNGVGRIYVNRVDYLPLPNEGK